MAISPSCLGTHQERTAVNELQNCKQKMFASKETEQEPKADPNRKLGQSSSHGTIFQSFRHAKTFPTEAEKQVAPASIRTVQYYSWENKWLGSVMLNQELCGSLQHLCTTMRPCVVHFLADNLSCLYDCCMYLTEWASMCPFTNNCQLLGANHVLCICFV